jgi:hypothetical protein
MRAKYFRHMAWNKSRAADTAPLPLNKNDGVCDTVISN